MQNIADTLNIPVDIVNNTVWMLIALAAILVLRRLVRRIVAANIDDTEGAYRANKIVNYVSTAIFSITVAFIWIEAFDDLPTYLGLVSAGIAIALADVLRNMAAWVYLLIRRPMTVGDRIEVDGHKGDVVDIRLFRFSLMEIGGWVGAEQPTGRLVHVPNGVVFTEEVANYTEGFEYVWHEIPVLITFESDWKLAETLLLEVLEEDTPDVLGVAGDNIRATAQRYSIRANTLTPTVYLSVKDSGVELTARFLVEARSRRKQEDKIWRSILEAFDQQPTIDLAYPTVRTYFGGPIQLDKG